MKASGLLVTSLILHVYGDRGLHANLFEAFDCSWPEDLQDISYTSHPNCLKSQKVIGKRNATYQLLQEERISQTTGHSCRMLKTRKVSYCGTYDHMTSQPHLDLNKVGVTL